jgi:hypothetical protein
VREILVVRNATMVAELPRRDADDSWPDRAETIEGGELVLDSIAFRRALSAIHRTTKPYP